jgi:hypothetical protein
VRKKSSAEDAMIAPTSISPSPIARPNSPTVASTVAFPIIMTKTARRTTVVAIARCLPTHLREVK